MKNRIVRFQEVLERTGLSRSTIYRKIARGTFPPRIRIGSRAIGWHLDVFEEWVARPR